MIKLSAKVHIKIGKDELKLSPDEMRNLRDLLCDLVGPREVVRYYPNYWPTTPWITHTSPTVFSPNLCSQTITLTDVPATSDTLTVSSGTAAVNQLGYTTSGYCQTIEASPH